MHVPFNRDSYSLGLFSFDLIQQAIGWLVAGILDELSLNVKTSLHAFSYRISNLIYVVLGNLCFEFYAAKMSNRNRN